MIHTITNLQYIEDNWTTIANILEPSTDTRCTLQNVYDNLMSGEWSLLSINDDDNKPVVLATVSYIHYPNSTSFNIILLAGALNKQYDLMVQLEDIARSNGCDEIEISGRKGWQRILPDYEFSHITLRKSL